MTFEVKQYQERSPRIEAVTFTGEFDNAGLLANFAGATRFEASRTSGILLLHFDTVDEQTLEILATETVSIQTGEVLTKCEGQVRAMPSAVFLATYEPS